MKTTTDDGQEVRAQVPNPDLTRDDDWGWVHHGKGPRWHTLTGTNLEEVGDKLVLVNDGPPAVAAMRVIDLTR